MKTAICALVIGAIVITLLTLTDAQKTALDALRAKVDQASNSMATVCDATSVFTVNGERAASQKELAAAVVVVRAILPAEQKCYGTLTADQKTQFDELVSWPTF